MFFSFIDGLNIQKNYLNCIRTEQRKFAGSGKKRPGSCSLMMNTCPASSFSGQLLADKPHPTSEARRVIK
jgi:hypothetical protein